MKIKIFATGGSIDKKYSTKASDFVVGEPVIEAVLQEVNATLDYEMESLLRKDSLEITEADRYMLLGKVQATSQQHIIITHGTDTIIQTAKTLNVVPDKVIVLTGAMQPAAFKQTDAIFNIGCAIIAVQTLSPGVYVVMNGRIFNPQQSHKNLEADRFEEK